MTKSSTTASRHLPGRIVLTLAAVLVLGLVLPAHAQDGGYAARAKITPPTPVPVAPAPATYGNPPPKIDPTQPQPGFNGARMVMSRDVWQRFVVYLSSDATTGFGFFMITVDGQASQVKTCADYACQISPLEQDAALDDCKTQSHNRRCVVFAEGRNIKMGYQVLP